MLRHSRVLLAAVAFGAAAAADPGAAQRVAAAETALTDANDKAASAHAKLRAFVEARKGRNATAFALSVERDAASAAANEQTSADKILQLRIGVLRSAATDASASKADTETAIQQAKSAAALVLTASDHQRQDMSRRYRKLQKDEKAEGRSLEKNAKSAAKEARRAALTLEQARHEAGEHGYKHDYDHAQNRDDDLEDSAENLRDNAEDATEDFYDRVEQHVESRMDALGDEASRRKDEQDRTISGLRHTAEKRLAAAAKAAPVLSGNVADVSAGRAPLLLVLALGGLAGSVTFALRRRRIAEPTLLG